MIEISRITPNNLRNHYLQVQLPEFFALKNCVENNSWHNEDSVFSHTLNVLDQLQKLLKTTDSKTSAYLNKKVSKFTRKDLLILSALLHDIAKDDTMISKDGITSCPNHEEVGSKKVQGILKRFDLSPEETAIVTHTIKHHGKIHAILSPKNQYRNKQLDELRLEYSDIFVELMLLGMSDTLGSQLKDNNRQEFDLRISHYETVIHDFWK